MFIVTAKRLLSHVSMNPPSRSRLDHHSHGKHAASKVDTVPKYVRHSISLSIGRQRMIGTSKIRGKSLKRRLLIFRLPGGSIERFSRAISV